MYNDSFLERKLSERVEQNAFRQLIISTGTKDFCSNDYLGIATNKLLKSSPGDDNHYNAGSTGSRLLSGNYKLIEEAEKGIASFHNSEGALIYNSGYDANVGLLSSVPQKGDTVIYDYLSHASIRDGIRLSFAQSYSFAHNDVVDLEKKVRNAQGNIFVVTESVFSMDGDVCPLQAIVALTEKYNAHLIIDEAHATGVLGEKGEGLTQHIGMEKKCFARVHTFGKGVGCHGAVVLGSLQLRSYLINFSRPFIYSTALPPSSVHAILKSYTLFPLLNSEREHLRKLITLFRSSTMRYEKITSETPIQGVIIPGNEKVKEVAKIIQGQGFDVRPILYPTVPKGKERIRIVLHAFNSKRDVEELVDLMR